MGGWSINGFRVELGSSISIERRDFYTFAGTEENPGDQTEVIAITPRKRTVTVERAEFRGLTKAGAAAKSATADWTIVSRDRVDNSGQWVVAEEKTTEGAWEDE